MIKTKKNTLVTLICVTHMVKATKGATIHHNQMNLIVKHVIVVIIKLKLLFDLTIR